MSADSADQKIVTITTLIIAVPVLIRDLFATCPSLFEIHSRSMKVIVVVVVVVVVLQRPMEYPYIS
jgi:hypothetical protein